MKKIIDGKTYNTETAERLHHTNEGGYPGNYEGFEETLYITKKGTHFLHGIGNANSRYADRRPPGRSPGEDIKVLSKREAIDYFKEQYRKEFEEIKM
jgi:hypothetical protein